jgi:acetyl esterase/lipase
LIGSACYIFKETVKDTVPSHLSIIIYNPSVFENSQFTLLFFSFRIPFKVDLEYDTILQSLYGHRPAAPAAVMVGDVEPRRARMEPGIAALADPNFPLDRVSTRDYFADTSDGQKILLLWYSADHKSPSQAVIYVHSGNMMGSVKAYNNVVAAYAARTGVPFLAVDYRLAPEHPHPIPVNDVYAALHWLVAHSKDLGVDSSRIGIMGDSAGGGLTVATALLARQDNGPCLSKLILLSPMLDDRTVSADEHLAPFLS